MTYDEFRAQYRAYDWEPYAPLALIPTSGERVYIDMPEQAALAAGDLIVTRRAKAHRPERYRYADLDRLVPLTDLPADPGGMSHAEFDPLIRELLMAEPFQPFVIELKNGQQIEVNERGGTTRAGRFIAIWTDTPRRLVRVHFDQIAVLRCKALAAAEKE
jgi:hypothetical protein